MTDLCECCGVWCCRMTAETSYRPPPYPLPPPLDPPLPPPDWQGIAAAESEHSAHLQLETDNLIYENTKKLNTVDFSLSGLFLWPLLSVCLSYLSRCVQWPVCLPVIPFSVCSMICLMAFFRLLALSISCSLGLKMAAAAEEEEEVFVRGEQDVWGGWWWWRGGGGSTTPSTSSCSSAMVGGGAWWGMVEAWDSSFRVFSNESSFSFSTPHWQTGITSQDTEWWNTLRPLHSITHSSIRRHRMNTRNNVIQFGFLILEKWWNSSGVPAFRLQP